MFIYHRFTYLTVILFAVAASACEVASDTPTKPPRYFEFTHQNGENEYTFVAQTSVPGIIDKVEDELSKPLEERTLHINGPIARGTEQYNDNWSWHFVPDEWDLAEASAEACDETPQRVEKNLDYWVDEAETFCPWSSRVSREVNN